uniref:Uncharacterized protein n=1 Tax=Triticum urartu TaxID=4572 RepID=A0A8R7V0Y1_TRIUA
MFCNLSLEALDFGKISIQARTLLHLDLSSLFLAQGRTDLRVLYFVALVFSRSDEMLGILGKAGDLQDEAQSRHFARGHARHCRALLPSIRAEDEEPPCSAGGRPPAVPSAGAGAAPRGPRGPPERGRPVPHLPGLPPEDQRPGDLSEQGERHQGGDHHVRAQGLGVRGAEDDDVRQPHQRPAQVADAVPRAAQVLLAGRVQQAEQPQPGGHLRGVAVHAQPHRQHGQHPDQVHVVQPQDQQQRLLHPPGRRLRGRQGAAADADLQERPAAGPGARARPRRRQVL